MNNNETGQSGSKQKIPMLRELVEERKAKAVETLSAGYAKNRLPLEEYERLVEYINKIESERELTVVEKIVAEYDPGEPAAASSEQKFSQNQRYADQYYDEQENSHPFRISDSNLTLLSSRVFSGPIKSNAQHVSILGSEHIKIRRADLKRGQTFLDIVTILGECVIYVEPGIRVANKAVPILGGAWVENKVNQRADGEQELVVSGAALLGNITVKLLKETE